MVRSLCLLGEDVLNCPDRFHTHTHTHTCINILCNRVTFRRMSFSYIRLAVYTLPFSSLLNFC